MSNHLARLVRSGATLIDLQNDSNNVLSNWELSPYDEKAICVEDVMTLNPRGATTATFHDNLVTLGRALIDGADNYYQYQHGYPYTPIFLQFRQFGTTTILQSEWFGGDPEAVENWASGALRSNLVPNYRVKFKRRPYWEETSAQALATAQSVSVNGGTLDISGIRGDIPTPLTILVRAGTTNQDRVIIAAKSSAHGQTIANFVNKYEAESYSVRGSGVADLTDANFSGAGAPQGQRWTVGTTAEQLLLSWDITSNISDQLGTYRVFVRCRDNRVTADGGMNVKIRVRAGIYTTGNSKQYGDYGALAKYNDGTGTGGANNSATTTAIPIVDCGIITLPPVDTQGVAPSKMILELYGDASSTSGSPTFDIDALYLMPLYETPMRTGYAMVRFPIEMGNGAAPDGIVTGADRVARGYLDSAGVLQYAASEIRGSPIYAWNSRSVRLFIMTQRDSNLRHTQSVSSTITVTAIPRYRFPVKSS